MQKGTVKWFNDSKEFGDTSPKEDVGHLYVEFGSVTVSVSTPKKSKVRRNVIDGQIALARAISKIVKPGIKINAAKGVPLFHAESEHPGLIVRELNGKRALGSFVNGKFRIGR